MRAILINADNQTIEEVNIIENVEVLDQWYKYLNVELVTVGLELNEHDSILVDDEGLLKNPDNFFYYKGAHQPFAGNGLIVGTDEDGKSVSCNIDLDTVKANVKFMTIDHNSDGIVLRTSEYDIKKSNK